MDDSAINFNDYSTAERYQIISGILKKTSKGRNGAPAKRFFEFYFTKFYKLPAHLRNDIVYCQRAIKCHLQVHQLVVQVFAQQEDADPLQKDKILRSIEDIVFDINAECSFLTIMMREHIKEFCAVFKDNGVDYDNGFACTIVSQEISPLVCNTQIDIRPINVLVRETKDQLIQRFFTVNEEDPDLPATMPARTPRAKQATTPEIIETVDVSDDEDNDGNATIEVPKNKASKKQAEFPKSYAQRAVQQGAVPKKKAASKQMEAASKNLKATSKHTKAAVSEPQIAAARSKQQQQYKDGPSTSKGKVSKQVQSLAGQEPEEAKSDQVRASRLNFLKVLKRSRNERIQHPVEVADNVAVADGGAKSGTNPPATNKQQQNKHPAAAAASAQKNPEENVPRTAANDQNMYLRMFGLCTTNEHKRMAVAQTQLKLRSYNNNRFNKK